MAKPADLPLHGFSTQAAWRDWLDQHHATSDGIRLKFALKASGIESVSYAEALDVALAYGWIDGVKGKIDQDWWTQRFGPRRAGSRWSKINTAKVDALIAAGEMRPAGLAEVEKAKADGRWQAAYAGARSIGVPDDLKAALDASPKAKAAFEGLDGANRYAILYRLQDAKKPETRARRLETFIGMLERGERWH